MLANKNKEHDIDIERLSQRLHMLELNIQRVFEMTGENGIEEVLEDLRDVASYVGEVSKLVDRCRKRHTADYDDLWKRADAAKKLATAIHEVKIKCRECRGPCMHSGLTGDPQLSAAMADARAANVFGAPPVLDKKANYDVDKYRE